MKRILTLLAILLLFGATRAGALCTQATTVTNVSVAVSPPNNNGRKYLLVQDTGASFDIFCTIGVSPATTSNGQQIFHGGGAWVLGGTGIPLPSGEVDCITASGSTSVVVCEF